MMNDEWCPMIAVLINLIGIFKMDNCGKAREIMRSLCLNRLQNDIYSIVCVKTKKEIIILFE